MIVAVPPETPVTSPEPVPTVAIDVELLVHTPPLVASLNVDVAEVQSVVVPVILAGVLITVTVFTAAAPQPFE